MQMFPSCRPAASGQQQCFWLSKVFFCSEHGSSRSPPNATHRLMLRPPWVCHGPAAPGAGPMHARTAWLITAVVNRTSLLKHRWMLSLLTSIPPTTQKYIPAQRHNNPCFSPRSAENKILPLSYIFHKLPSALLELYLFSHTYNYASDSTGLEGQVKSRPTHSTPCEAMAARPRHVPPTTALLSAAACTGWGAHPAQGLTPKRGWPQLGKSPLCSRGTLNQEAVLLMLTSLTTRQNTWQQLLIIRAVLKYFTLTNIVIKYL